MIDRRGFFSRLAGVALLPALASFAPEPEVLIGYGIELKDDGVHWWVEGPDGIRKEGVVPEATSATMTVSECRGHPKAIIAFTRPTGSIVPLDYTGRNWQYIPPDRRS